MTDILPAARHDARRAALPPGARRRRSTVRAAALVASALTVAGCTAARTGNSPDAGASAVVSSLGAVPVPTAPPTDPTPTASGTHLQVLAMGEPVVAVLPDGARAVVTASGPAQAVNPTLLGPGVAPTTPATITVTVASTAGTVPIAVSDLICRDDTGTRIALTPVGPASVTAASGTSASLQVVGTFRSGAAQLTWAHAGRTVAVWDFNIELD